MITDEVGVDQMRLDEMGGRQSQPKRGKDKTIKQLYMSIISLLGQGKIKQAGTDSQQM